MMLQTNVSNFVSTLLLVFFLFSLLTVKAFQNPQKLHIPDIFPFNGNNASDLHLDQPQTHPLMDDHVTRVANSFLTLVHEKIDGTAQSRCPTKLHSLFFGFREAVQKSSILSSLASTHLTTRSHDPQPGLTLCAVAKKAFSYSPTLVYLSGSHMLQLSLRNYSAGMFWLLLGS